MTGDQQDIVTILVKYALHEPLTGEEEQELARWRQRSAEHAAMPEQFRDVQWMQEQRKNMHNAPTQEMWEDISRYIAEHGGTAPVVDMPSRRRIGMARYAVAGLALVAMVYGGMRWSQNRRLHDVARQSMVAMGSTVLLTLDDGSQIALDTLKTGAIIAENRVRIRKADSNSYVYTTGSRADLTVRHRLMLAPGAGVIRVQWSDGSSAWLRPGSSLDYPVDLRSAAIKIAGEAWLRLAHQPEQPANLLLADGRLVRVLGTSFDVYSAGPDSPQAVNRVALFSGKVRVVKGDDSVLLRPLTQATMGGQGLNVSPIDSNLVLAWLRPAVKTRDFEFRNADLLTMLPEIGAWYRVQVVNPRQLRGTGITGEFLRSMSLQELITNLKLIESAHAQIDLRDDTIFVEPLKAGH